MKSALQLEKAAPQSTPGCTTCETNFCFRTLVVEVYEQANLLIKGVFKCQIIDSESIRLK
jgi:hypothetical protein